MPAAAEALAKRTVPAMVFRLLHRLGRSREAAAARRQVVELMESDAERAFLAERLAGPHEAWLPGGLDRPRGPFEVAPRPSVHPGSVSRVSGGRRR